MRLFVAVELNEAARAAVAAEQRRLASAMAGAARSLRFVRAEHLHLTLVFLGEVNETQAAAIASAMARDIDQAPYTMTLGGTGVFPPHGPPRVLWLGLMEGADRTISLYEAVEARLQTAGIERDPRPFSPHLTLARWRDGSPRDRQAVPPSRGRLASVQVDAVTLFESRLSSAGPSYTALARARLLCP